MRRRQDRGKRLETTGELNLIPVMNLFVCLIPFLLMSAAFVQLGAIDAETPSQTEKKAESTEPNPSVQLIVQVSPEAVQISAYTRSFQNRLEGVDLRFALHDLNALSQGLEKLVEEHSSIDSTLFRVGGESAYKDAVAVLAQLRKTEGLGKLVLATEVVR
ncbi:MAG: hypothetical protein EA369_08135 [Bradymonadales bacterium]|nr:MAG: hypothetical protein EA369_08135 [Bradymonadales bacterium]